MDDEPITIGQLLDVRELIIKTSKETGISADVLFKEYEKIFLEELQKEINREVIHSAVLEPK